MTTSQKDSSKEFGSKIHRQYPRQRLINGTISFENHTINGNKMTTPANIVAKEYSLAVTTVYSIGLNLVRFICLEFGSNFKRNSLFASWLSTMIEINLKVWRNWHTGSMLIYSVCVVCLIHNFESSKASSRSDIETQYPLRGEKVEETHIF